MYIIYRKLKIKRSEKTSYRDTKIALKKKKKKKERDKRYFKTILYKKNVILRVKAILLCKSYYYVRII